MASGASMKFNTSLGLTLTSLGLFLLHGEWLKHSKTRLIVGNLAACGVLLIGVLTMLEYFLDVQLGIDEFIVTDFPSPESQLYPGRMAPMASVCFGLIGLALIDLNFKKHQDKFPVLCFLLFPVLIICLFAVVGYIYDVQALYQVAPFIRISWQTATLFLILSIGILLARPESRLVRILFSRSAAGMMMRRLLPMTILLPILFGWMRIMAQEYGLVEFEMGTAMRTVVSVVVFSTLLWFTGKKVEGMEAEKNKLSNQFEAVIQKIDVGVGLASADGRVQHLNPAALAMHGFASQSQMLSRISQFTKDFEMRYPDGRKMPLEDWPMARASRGETVSNYDVLLIHKNSSLTRYLSYSVVPIRNAAGETVNIVFNMLDLTARKQNEDQARVSERKFTAMFESAPYPMALVKWPSGVIADVNSMWMKVFGHTRMECIGKTSIELGWYKDVGERRRLCDKFAVEGRVRGFEVSVLTKSGEERIVLTNMDPMQFDGEQYFLGTVQDITDLRKGEARVEDPPTFV